MDVAEYTELFPSALPAAREDAFRAWVSIAVGCDTACTFCIVPFVRGAQRSRAIGDVLAEVQGLARDGVVEVTLIRGGGVLHGRNTGPPNSATTTWGALAFNVTRYVGVESEAGRGSPGGRS